MVDDSIPDINEILGNAVVVELDKISARTLSKIKAIWLRYKYYGFTPTPSEAELLKEISKNSTYITFAKCVGKYEYNAFIKIGLLIYELNELGNNVRVNEIRNYVYGKHGNVPKKIIQIASTGILLHVLEYLTNLRDEKNLSSDVVREEFINIVTLWESVSVPVSSSVSEKYIIGLIKKIIEKKAPIFFVYAAGNAAYRGEIIVAELNNLKLFSGKYLPWCKVRVVGKVKKIEHFLGVFYSVEEVYDTHLFKKMD